MLDENEIIDILRRFLTKNGYAIDKFCTTIEHGVDIIATHSTHKLYVEAKGETSSKSGSGRFGFAFDDDQIKTHIAVALLQSMTVLHNKPAGPKTKVGIALPDTQGHREAIELIINPIRTLGIKIFWVSFDGVAVQS